MPRRPAGRHHREGTVQQTVASRRSGQRLDEACLAYPACGAPLPCGRARFLGTFDGGVARVVHRSVARIRPPATHRTASRTAPRNTPLAVAGDMPSQRPRPPRSGAVTGRVPSQVACCRRSDAVTGRMRSQVGCAHRSDALTGRVRSQVACGPGPHTIPGRGGQLGQDAAVENARRRNGARAETRKRPHRPCQRRDARPAAAAFGPQRRTIP